MIIEPEIGLFLLKYLNVTTQSWLYFLQECFSCLKVEPFVPRTSTQKLLARNAMPHVTGRWAKQRSHEILTAYFNAIGYNAWENIWGIWNGFNDRDGELLRRCAIILRHFHEFIVQADVTWLPYYPVLAQTQSGQHVFVSKFIGQGKELFLLINTGTQDAEEHDWSLTMPGAPGDQEFYNVHAGLKLKPEMSAKCLVMSCSVKGAPDASTVIRLRLEAVSAGAVLRVPAGQLRKSDATFLANMRELTSRSLASFSNTWGPVTTQELVQPAAQQAAKRVPLSTQGMLQVKGNKSYEFRVNGTEIEGFQNKQGVMDDWKGVDVQYPWETFPTKYHEAHVLAIEDLWFDKYPVTNSQFQSFMNRSEYSPKDSQGFLRHWGSRACSGHGSCQMPANISQQPVVFISLEDARSYCAFYGKRLPHEWEWQYAAQGGDPAQPYPWGLDWQPERMPAAQPNVGSAGLADVGQHPSGASRDGIQDLLGLVWHWTDEYEDLHTRAAVLKGGSAFQPNDWRESRYQPWYFPGLVGNWTEGAPYLPPYTVTPKNYSQLYHVNRHAKYLLMAPSLDRAGTIGFRCVAAAQRLN
eukprot:TRINITY_DN76412_c0_g1_i1.p1 TRINITY_DN76412_c0_g1~~TRINITY_DN76412_c0_g1_i1.p1  ORF type:complete len:644 (-),score=91.87 TRINITY_DN76412_c0_g1_i1:224-1963(-)